MVSQEKKERRFWISILCSSHSAYTISIASAFFIPQAGNLDRFLAVASSGRSQWTAKSQRKSQRKVGLSRAFNSLPLDEAGAMRCDAIRCGAMQCNVMLTSLFPRSDAKYPRPSPTRQAELGLFGRRHLRHHLRAVPTLGHCANRGPAAAQDRVAVPHRQRRSRRRRTRL